MDSKTKQKLKKVFVPIVVFLSFSSLCIAMLKFYGQCAGQSTCAILVTIFLLHSWFFDREFRSRIMESSVRIYTILMMIFLIIILWLSVYVFCVEAP